MMIKDPFARPCPRDLTPASRRKFMVGGAALGFTGLGLGLSEPAQAGGWALEAYASSTSIRAGGGAMTIYGRDPLAGSSDTIHAMTVVRVGVPEVTMLSTTVRLRNRAVPSDAFASGCDWPASQSFAVPRTWPSGLYLVRIGSDGRGVEVPFVVRPAAGAARNKILVQVPFTTMQAYNPYGGKSLYEYNSSLGTRASKVSFDRPWQYQSYEANDPWMWAFVLWLSSNGYRCDFCSSLDLHGDAGALTGYSLMLTAGHDEYWSRAMRQRVDSFVTARGNVAVFGGNTCWWQVRFESGVRSHVQGRTMVCYKDRRADPMLSEPSKTINWGDLQTPWPETSSFGLGSRSGAIWSNGLPRPPVPWLVKQPNHWAFSGTGLKLNAAFGAAQVGYETDAAQWILGADQLPYATGLDGAPAHLKVLAMADCTSWASSAQAQGSAAQGGYAMVSVFSRQGTVFNAGSVDWALGLRQELITGSGNPLGVITRNVLNKLQSMHSEPSETGIRPVRQYSLAQPVGEGRIHQWVCGDDVPAGWTAEKIAFSAYARPVAGSSPVYRYHAPQASGQGRRYLYSLSSEVGYGWTLNGVAFHVPSASSLQSTVVYQHHIVQNTGDGWRMFYSLNASEPGWGADGPVFYALTA